MAANTDLTGDSISATYTQLLHIGDDSGIEATEHYVVDGNGTASALSLGTTAVGIGTASPAFSNGSGLEIEKAGATTLRLQNTSDSKTVELSQSSTSFNVDLRNSQDFKIQQSGSDKVTIDSSGNVGIGVTTPQTLFHVSNATAATIAFSDSGAGTDEKHFYIRTESGVTGFSSLDDSYGYEKQNMMAFDHSTGNVLVGKTSTDMSAAGHELLPNRAIHTAASDSVMLMNRTGNDGTIVAFYQAGSLEGTISVSGATVSYNSFLGSHNSKMANDEVSEIEKGTVISTIDEIMDGYGDRLPKFKVSDSEGDKRVYGVFGWWNYDDVEYEEDEEYDVDVEVEWDVELPSSENTKDEIKSFMDEYGFEYNSGDTKQDLLDKIPSYKSIETQTKSHSVTKSKKADSPTDATINALGAGLIRVSGSCEGGDLLESNGDGTARVQDDDIIRSKTIAKVTVGNNDEGVSLVPCVLYCG